MAIPFLDPPYFLGDGKPKDPGDLDQKLLAESVKKLLLSAPPKEFTIFKPYRPFLSQELPHVYLTPPLSLPPPSPFPSLSSPPSYPSLSGYSSSPPGYSSLAAKFPKADPDVWAAIDSILKPGASAIVWDSAGPSSPPPPSSPPSQEAMKPAANFEKPSAKSEHKSTMDALLAHYITKYLSTSGKPSGLKKAVADYFAKKGLVSYSSLIATPPEKPDPAAIVANPKKDSLSDKETHIAAGFIEAALKDVLLVPEIPFESAMKALNIPIASSKPAANQILYHPNYLDKKKSPIDYKDPKLFDKYNDYKQMDPYPDVAGGGFSDDVSFFQKKLFGTLKLPPSVLAGFGVQPPSESVAAKKPKIMPSGLPAHPYQVVDANGQATICDDLEQAQALLAKLSGEAAPPYGTPAISTAKGPNFLDQEEFVGSGPMKTHAGKSLKALFEGQPMSVLPGGPIFYKPKFVALDKAPNPAVAGAPPYSVSSGGVEEYPWATLTPSPGVIKQYAVKNKNTGNTIVFDKYEDAKTLVAALEAAVVPGADLASTDITWASIEWVAKEGEGYYVVTVVSTGEKHTFASYADAKTFALTIQPTAKEPYDPYEPLYTGPEVALGPSEKCNLSDTFDLPPPGGYATTPKPKTGIGLYYFDEKLKGWIVKKSDNLAYGFENLNQAVAYSETFKTIDPTAAKKKKPFCYITKSGLVLPPWAASFSGIYGGRAFVQKPAAKNYLVSILKKKFKSPPSPGELAAQKLAETHPDTDIDTLDDLLEAAEKEVAALKAPKPPTATPPTVEGFKTAAAKIADAKFADELGKKAEFVQELKEAPTTKFASVTPIAGQTTFELSPIGAKVVEIDGQWVAHDGQGGVYYFQDQGGAYAFVHKLSIAKKYLADKGIDPNSTTWDQAIEHIQKFKEAAKASGIPLMVTKQKPAEPDSVIDIDYGVAPATPAINPFVDPAFKPTPEAVGKLNDKYQVYPEPTFAPAPPTPKEQLATVSKLMGVTFDSGSLDKLSIEKLEEFLEKAHSFGLQHSAQKLLAKIAVKKAAIAPPPKPKKAKKKSAKDGLQHVIDVMKEGAKALGLKDEVEKFETKHAELIAELADNAHALEKGLLGIDPGKSGSVTVKIDTETTDLSSPPGPIAFIPGESLKPSDINLFTSGGMPSAKHLNFGSSYPLPKKNLSALESAVLNNKLAMALSAIPGIAIDSAKLAKMEEKLLAEKAAIGSVPAAGSPEEKALIEKVAKELAKELKIHEAKALIAELKATGKPLDAATVVKLDEAAKMLTKMEQASADAKLETTKIIKKPWSAYEAKIDAEIAKLASDAAGYGFPIPAAKLLEIKASFKALYDNGIELSELEAKLAAFKDTYKAAPLTPEQAFAKTLKLTTVKPSGTVMVLSATAPGVFYSDAATKAYAQAQMNIEQDKKAIEAIQAASTKKFIELPAATPPMSPKAAMNLMSEAAMTPDLFVGLVEKLAAIGSLWKLDFTTGRRVHTSTSKTYKIEYAYPPANPTDLHSFVVFRRKVGEPWGEPLISWVRNAGITAWTPEDDLLAFVAKLSPKTAMDYLSSLPDETPF